MLFPLQKAAPSNNVFCGGLVWDWLVFVFPCFTSGILLKHDLQWGSHKANAEPEFSVFLNLQCEEIHLCHICGGKSSFNSSC